MRYEYMSHASRRATCHDPVRWDKLHYCGLRGPAPVAGGLGGGAASVFCQSWHSLLVNYYTLNQTGPITISGESAGAG